MVLWFGGNRDWVALCESSTEPNRSKIWAALKCGTVEVSMDNEPVEVT